MNRRDLLKRAVYTGGTLAVCGSGVAGWRAAQAGLMVRDDAPFAPWEALASARLGDPHSLAAAAILASSPHNTQPWLLSVSPDRFAIEADTIRHLGSFDPFRREMWIGLGAAAANAEIAASVMGFEPSTFKVEDLGPDGIGRIAFSLSPSSPERNLLFEAMPRRRTNRTPYSNAPVREAQMERVIELVGAIKGARLRVFERESTAGPAFAENTIEATRAIIRDRDMSHDGHVWFRANAREVARYRDGVSVPTAGLSPVMSVLGQLMPEPDEATSGRYWLASTERQLAGTAGFGIILVDDLDDRASQVAAGKMWQRLHLALTNEGLAAQPMNQLPEMVDRDRALGQSNGWFDRTARLAGQGGYATFAFRFGVPLRDVPKSARRPTEWVLS